MLSIRRELGVPILFIGTGEGLSDLAPFDAGEFVDAHAGAGGLTLCVSVEPCRRLSPG